MMVGLAADPDELRPEKTCGGNGESTIKARISGGRAASGRSRFRASASCLSRHGGGPAAARSADPGTTRTVTVNLCLESFDATTEAGHTHGEAARAEEYWGLLGGSVALCNGGASVPCNLQVDDRGESELTVCTLYARGRAGFSGKTTIKGTVTGEQTLEATTVIDIGLKGLAPLSSVSSNFWRFLRDPAWSGLHPAADYLAPGAFEGAQRMAWAFYTDRLGRAAEQFPDYPDGFILSFNDMSLPRGGAFDIQGHWAEDTTDFGILEPGCQNPVGHCGHRSGTGVDANRRTYLFNADGPGPMAPEAARLTRTEFEDACDAASGTVVPEATYHCEF